MFSLPLLKLFLYTFFFFLTLSSHKRTHEFTLVVFISGSPCFRFLILILFIFHRQNSSCSVYAIDLNDTSDHPAYWGEVCYYLFNDHRDFPNRQRIDIALHCKGIRSILSRVQKSIEAIRPCVGSFRSLQGSTVTLLVCLFFYLCPANIFSGLNTKTYKL